jgi:regulatory protein
MPEGTITALRAQENDSQRVNMFLDGAFALGISLDTLAREGLYVGQHIDAACWQRLESAEQASKALNAALRFLQTRPRSVAEVRERLQRKQFAAPLIEQTIARLSDMGMLDDNAFARFWVENRNTCRPRGPQALRSELYRKGIDRTVIDATLQDDALMGDEHERALLLARGVFAKYASAPDRSTFQRRLGGYLQRRGFGYDTIRPILDLLWQEASQQQDAAVD